jgi:hypothetical protein
MKRDELEAWARMFVADLTPGGMQVPLRRIMKRHVAQFAELRALGLTWKGIANCLDQAGRGVPGYMPISADLLRANFARLDVDPAPPQPQPARSSRMTLTAQFSPENKLGSVVAFGSVRAKV